MFSLFAVTAVFLASGCGTGKNNDGKFDHYVAEITAVRKEKDEAFKHSPTSPLPTETKEDFDGLNYYPVRPEYRIVADFLPIQGGIVDIAMTNGKSERYYKTGYATFAHAESRHSLLVLRSAEAPNELFLPFYDKTNGIETYGGGRYLNPQLISDSKIVIDFNLAYNPYCVYSGEFVCPLPPPENRLNVSIEAGEKIVAKDPGLE